MDHFVVFASPPLLARLPLRLQIGLLFDGDHPSNLTVYATGIYAFKDLRTSGNGIPQGSVTGTSLVVIYQHTVTPLGAVHKVRHTRGDGVRDISIATYRQEEATASSCFD